MLKSVKSLKVSDVICLQIRENLYTLAQVRENHLVQFFDIWHESGAWADVNLDNVEPLFCAYVSLRSIRSILVGVVSPSLARPNSAPTPKRMLDFDVLSKGSAGDYRVDLIELDNSYDSLQAQRIKEDLTPKHDLQAIYEHELTTMEGDPKSLSKRLARYYDTGVNWDDQKSFIFPSIPLPKAAGKHETAAPK